MLFRSLSLSFVLEWLMVLDYCVQNGMCIYLNNLSYDSLMQHEQFHKLHTLSHFFPLLLIYKPCTSFSPIGATGKKLLPFTGMQSPSAFRNAQTSAIIYQIMIRSDQIQSSGATLDFKNIFGMLASIMLSDVGDCFLP